MRIFYICTGNSFRSPVAEALTRKLRPEFEVESAGINPASAVAENAKELLSEEGALEYAKPGPDPVTERAIEDADVIVVMNKRHENFLRENFDISDGAIKNWQVDDPINPEVSAEESFGEIKNKIENF